MKPSRSIPIKMNTLSEAKSPLTTSIHQIIVPPFVRSNVKMIDAVIPWKAYMM